jgi:hypothetical protein
MLRLEYLPHNKCYLESKAHQCCCVCINRKRLMGHPWFNKQSISKHTGIYVCIADKDNKGECMLTGEHSIGCEHFSRKGKP